MAPLVKTFEELHQEYKGRIYWETIPPGLLVKQMQNGGTVTSGNMTWTVKADAYFAGLMKVKELIDDGLLVAPAVPYVTNTLTIMVPKDNPAQITGLADLAKPEVRLAMPNPEFEGIARQIKASLQKAGGENLAKAVYEDKVKDGSAVLTHVHHRQTPLFLMQGQVQAGVTWQSEAIFQEQIGHPISHVEIPSAQNSTAIYAGAEVRGAAHSEAAKQWLEFIRSPEAMNIFERYGFKRYQAQSDEVRRTRMQPASRALHFCASAFRSTSRPRMRLTAGKSPQTAMAAMRRHARLATARKARADPMPPIRGWRVSIAITWSDSSMRLREGSRGNETMQPIAKALTPDERQAVAKFYAGLVAPRIEEPQRADDKTIAIGARWPTEATGRRGCRGVANVTVPPGRASERRSLNWRGSLLNI